jgi:COP9 signalosome complex subunit 5
MDSLYSINEDKLATVRQQKPWMHDPKYFRKVKISPSASIKMMMHGQQGVEKGVKQNGKPIEVMGLLLGRPDTEDPNSLVITDAQALPIEGFETKVIADDENVINYMIELGDALEVTRKERFCGWYHTHPFDVDVNGHCFLSNTDVTTQLQWQRSEDPHGNPWLAIVIDPLYSLAKNRPEMMAFRVYPPEHNARANETPDGSIVTDDRRRVELWGACWNRYYKLEIDYFMSALSQQTLGVLKNKFLWQNAFCGAATGEDGGVARTVGGVLQAVDSLPSSHHAGRGSHSMLYCSRESPAGSGGASALGAMASGAAEEGARKASTREKVGCSRHSGCCFVWLLTIPVVAIFVFRRRRLH